jgi:hypothetical protein
MVLFFARGMTRRRRGLCGGVGLGLGYQALKKRGHSGFQFSRSVGPSCLERLVQRSRHRLLGGYQDVIDVAHIDPSRTLTSQSCVFLSMEKQRLGNMTTGMGEFAGGRS